MTETSSTTLTLDQVEALSYRALMGSGASSAQAGPAARSIRDAEADGIRSVGLAYLPTYCEHVACGKVVGDAVPAVTTPRPATVLVDACHGFAHVAFAVGHAPLVVATRTCGIGILSISHSYSAGVLGWFVERLAEDGLVSVMFANSSATMAPVNDLPNPYRTVEGWAKLPDGRAWGSTSAVDIDKDGKHIWVAERCGVLPRERAEDRDPGHGGKNPSAQAAEIMRVARVIRRAVVTLRNLFLRGLFLGHAR